MYLIVLTFVSYVSACSFDNNLDGSGLNPDCNWAGVCSPPTNGVSQCYCCSNFLIEYKDQQTDICKDWVCDRNNPSVECIRFKKDGDCTVVLNGYYSNLGFRLEDSNPNSESDVICNTDPEKRFLSNNRLFGSLNESLVAEVNTVAKSRGWNGTVKDTGYCDTCTPIYPCTAATDLNITVGLTAGFQVDFNEFYDPECRTDGISFGWQFHPECEANYDYGVAAGDYWSEVSEVDAFLNDFNRVLRDDLGYQNTYAVAFAQSEVVRSGWKWILSPTPTSFPTSSPVPPTDAPTETPTTTPTETPTTAPTQIPTVSPTATPSQAPTDAPSQVPTAIPTQTPTARQCKPYANSIADIQFIGNGTNCRAGLEMSYPGGLTCESPYIICLPQENTPAQFGFESYYSNTHRYSVEECKQECANDQRCLGIEFVPDDDSLLGDCNLIDDIPLNITITNTDTDTQAVCMEKKDACYPYFEADDLDPTMLDCYCPNNRKGFYTKKVKRTVENTRFCGNDNDTEMRIKKAHANRMFHLCENWCLFDTENPVEEYWFWDPWRTCWREQEDDSSYCTHIIEDPVTIEMQFLMNRREHFCELNGQ